MTVEHFEGTYEAQTPISHGSDEDFGMEQRLRTIEMAVRDDGNLYHEDVPVLSGNGLRGQLRDLLAEDFLDAISTDDNPVELGDSLSNAFWAGGSLERSAGPGKLKRRMIQNIRENIPPLSLLGTALGSQMLDGRVNVGMLTPIATETEQFTGRESDHSVFQFVDGTFYTRMDDRVGGRQEDEGAQQMKYTVHVLTPGTRFHHRLTLKSASDIERACLGRAFELFAENPHVGGQQAVGHGRVEFQYDGGLPDSSPYMAFIEENRADIREFVNDLDEQMR
jgi:hypothetical protein